MQITVEQLKGVLGKRTNLSILKGFVEYFNKYSDDYEVNTYLRLCHFLAQVTIESDRFTTLKEYASGAEYEGRKDLGNTQKGDGKKYKGRGEIQLTGRANYASMGKILGIDLINHPELAETDEIALLVSLEYWKSRKINSLADKDDGKAVTHAVNGGYRNLSDRMFFLDKYKEVYKFMIQKDDSVVQYQKKLISLGYTEVGTPDGKIGPMTKVAITAFINDWNDRNPNQTLDTTINSFTPDLVKALDDAEPRVLSDARTSATASDLRKAGSTIVNTSTIGGVATGGLAIGTVVDGANKALDTITSTSTNISNSVEPIHSVLSIFHQYWWVLALILAGAIGYFFYKIIMARVEDHRTGNTRVVNL